MQFIVATLFAALVSASPMVARDAGPHVVLKPLKYEPRVWEVM